MKNLEKYVEHTLLKQDATKQEFEKLYEEAKKYNLGVCALILCMLKMQNHI